MANIHAFIETISRIDRFERLMLFRFNQIDQEIKEILNCQAGRDNRKGLIREDRLNNSAAKMYVLLSESLIALDMRYGNDNDNVSLRDDIRKLLAYIKGE